MKSKKYLWGVVMEIYNQMYREATPSADFDNLMKSGKTKKEGWFMKYTLPQERQNEILEALCKKHNLDKYERHKVSVEVNLGCAPRQTPSGKMS